jgi:thioredoxin-dependent peroxiredoxin
MSLRPGQPAPPFTLPRDGGGLVSLADFTGRAVVLFIYPGDSTPSCTVEAQDFSRLLPRFEAAGTVVLGLSSGGVAAKERFRARAGLSLPLLADETDEVLRAFGVWQEKTTFGRTYMGIVRTTVLIDRQGRVSQVWTVTRVRGHAEEVLEAAERLGAGSGA